LEILIERILFYKIKLIIKENTMKEHIKRKTEYAKGMVVFSEDDKKHLSSLQKKMIVEDPITHKEVKNRFKKAKNILTLQNSNGIGLNMDIELRHFLREFNHRSWNYGHSKMPLMFNIMEAFFNLDKKINSWKLLEEEDYLISFYDFLDFYTSHDFTFDIASIKEDLEEDLIYNFNVGSDINKITFKTQDEGEFVIAGVSILRRGNEITILFLTGEIIDTLRKTKDLEPLPPSSVSGKEKLKPAKDLKREAVKLNNDDNLWKVLVACRFDLETETIDARYVAKDEGNSYSILTDDSSGFFNNADGVLDKDNIKLFEKILTGIEKYSSIFELAKAVLYLPHYLNYHEEDIEEETHETNVKTIINTPIKKRQFEDIDYKYKIRNRSLWILNKNNNFSANAIILRDENFKIENNGYWKKLSSEEVGTDKKGKKITGKTWVERTESYSQVNLNDLIVLNNIEKQDFQGENVGYIYIMRNGFLDKGIFKIGLTKKNTMDRASQLSKTSVPDSYYVMREWYVKDCVKAEKEIHNILTQYRVDPRREFFRVDMRKANDVIDKVVEEINSM